MITVAVYQCLGLELAAAAAAADVTLEWLDNCQAPVKSRSTMLQNSHVLLLLYGGP